MVDICKCSDSECPKCKTCYRFVSIPDEYWQSYFRNSPRDGDKCDRYWEVK